MRPLILALLVLLSVGQVYAASLLDDVKVKVEPYLIYPGEEVNVTFTAGNPTDSRHIVVIKYRDLPEGFEGPSTTAVIILEPRETGAETLRFRLRPDIKVKNYFLYYDLIDEAYNATGALIMRNATGPRWHVVRMYEPIIKGLRKGRNYNLSMDDQGVNVSLELVNSLNRTHRITLAGKDLEERIFVLEPRGRVKALLRFEAPARADEYNFSFNATEEFYNGTGFAPLYQNEYRIEFRRQSLAEKLVVFLEEHPWVLQVLALALGLLALWVLRRRIKGRFLATADRIRLLQISRFYLRLRWKEASKAASLGIVALSRYLVLEGKKFLLEHKKLLAVGLSIFLINLLIFIVYQGHEQLRLVLIGNTSVVLTFLAFAFLLHPSDKGELTVIQHLRDISPRALIVDFLLLLLLAAYLISFRGEASARATADYAYYILVAAVLLRAHQFWKEGR